MLRKNFRALLLKVSSYLLDIIELQLFLTLVSWPLLLWWGLPLSSLTIIGNSIMAPYLSVCLALSSCAAFLSFFGFSNTYILLIFEYAWQLWHYLLTSCSCPPFIVYATPPLALCFIVSGIAASIVWFIKNKSLKIALYLVTFGAFMLVLSLIQKERTIKTVAMGNHYALLCKNNNKTGLIVPKAFNNCRKTEYWIKSSLMPLLTREMGIQQIDYCFVLRPTPSTHNFLQTLHARRVIKH